MSHISSQKNGGNNVPPPRQIRFVSTDGQPQTKRRRVNAACLTCRKRKIRCSGEQPVCKTCSDYNHVCQGYSEPTTHARSQSDSSARAATVAPLSISSENTSRVALKVETRSPDPPGRATVPPVERNDRPVAEPIPSEVKEASSVRDISSQTTKEPEQQTLAESPESSRTSLSSSARTHVPYFRLSKSEVLARAMPRYHQVCIISLAIRFRVPQDTGRSRTNTAHTESLSPLRSPRFPNHGINNVSGMPDTRDSRDYNTIPFYDRDDTLPVSNLVMHLCDLFFVHLGCSFPFLQRDRFLRDLKDKKVDTMLVDAICALSARFSLHPLLSPPQAPSIDGSEPAVDMKKSNRGRPFAHRAMSALVDSLSCPTISVVQACLLLAYEEFGSNHDSGLWMYLGISIRMAQDLGMQKVQGLEYNYGQSGVTPNAVLTGQAGKLRDDQYDEPQPSPTLRGQPRDAEGRRASERERVDSFWSIFFLDRVISSGTGRPVTLRDEEIELCFPLQSESRLPNGWPAPFPPLIRIIHLYGRVTDLINGIQDVKHVTSDTLKVLAGMESDLTGIYQRLSPRLHFNAANFQAYVKAKEGTNFILLHFVCLASFPMRTPIDTDQWFHTLIVLLHQPTLLHSFGGTIQHLYPNSRELSMSSAKTIADILSFSELVDGKSFIGNPFTSQPMYIAACAFLMESAYYSSPSSRSCSPPIQPLLTNQSSGFVMPSMDPATGSERKPTAKHILLASAAKENYQRCYKALKALETYWEGTRYILTVLDQKAKGIVDPLLYTVEEMESTAGLSSVQPLAAQPWRRTQSSDDTVGADPSAPGSDTPAEGRRSPKIDPSQAIGWALTGATNSSQPNLSLLYQMPAQTEPIPEKPTYSSQYSHSYPHIPVQPDGGETSYSYSQATESSRSTKATPGPSMASTTAQYSHLASSGRVTTSDANLLLGLNTTYPGSTSRLPNSRSAFNHQMPSAACGLEGHAQVYNYNIPSTVSDAHTGSGHLIAHSAGLHPDAEPHAGNVFIESQDVDMAMLQQNDQLPFAFSGEILPWLEYLPQDVLNYFGDNQNYPGMLSPDDETPRPH
ncbi:putative C6 transcription factor [Aspergillus brunneoviolaceus CBS 621.78]|uniref:Uncharacterized protein n=1 Tax=Aspergillus brunneoviolaceus CBS 621.78 TaxID=1450534 RepID=A0ACD1GLG3_9EURO|nr:hypothetical protein BO95DRAFT_193844 [Aspergillus brunneoviolaceus CBS 621.78]RAH50189.1 hypothetical protein BO95DRAFT_193844 [Aspergillus brunneoviolaceus CBS 621.78]